MVICQSQRHDCENSVFLPAEQSSKTSGGWFSALSILQIGGIYAKNEPNQCAFALCLPELHITLASPPFAAFARLAQHYSGHLHQAFNWAVGFQLKPTSLVTLKVALAKTQTMAIDITNAIQSWVRSL